MQKKIHNLILGLAYPLIDFIVLFFAIFSSYMLYHASGIGRQVNYSNNEIINICIYGGLFTILFLYISGAYKKESSVLNAEEIKNVIKGITWSFLFFTVIFVFLLIAPSRYMLFFAYLLSILLITGERTLFFHLRGKNSTINGVNEKILIYGAGDLGKRLYRSFLNSPKLGIYPLGFIDDSPGNRDKKVFTFGNNCSNGARVLGSRKEIPRLIKELNIAKIYVAISNIKFESLIKIIDYIKGQNIKVSFVPNLYSAFMYKIKVTKIGGLPVIEEDDDVKFFYIYIKRWFDFICASVLFILFLPVFVTAYIAIKLDSRGPVIFKQKRVGKDGKVFMMWKFRSMVKETNPYAINPVDSNDKRVTKVGKIMRKLSLDEVPQLVNVIKGEMSLVGPRPEMPFIVEQYGELENERLKVTPGITGLWQLSGDRHKAIHENMEYDLYYIKNVSFFLDLAILIETLIFAFRGI